MTDREKIGVRVDAELWEAFREDVKARKGQTRGVLGDEVESALRQYLSDDTAATVEDRLRRIERDVTRIADAQGLATADGGTDTSEGEIHTHAPSRVDAAADEKPAANAATDKKVSYLAAEVRDRVAGGRDKDFREVPIDVLREVVKDEYGFRADTAKRYVDRLREHFGLVEHPTADPLLVTPARREELLQADADDTLAEVADAE